MGTNTNEHGHIKISILAVQPEKLADLASYLKKYNFETTVFSTLASLVTSMEKELPDCILVSSEGIENASVTPMILEKQFHVPIIGYAEQPLMSSMALLNSMPTRYKIRPPISTASVYRTLQKVLAENKTLSESRS